MAKWIYERYIALVDFSTFPTTSNITVPNSTKVYKYGPDWRTREELTWGLISTGEGCAQGDPLQNNETTWLKKISLYGYQDYGTFLEIMNRYGKKGGLLESVTAEEGTLPDDGIHTDGYWYVKIKKAFPAMRILCDGQWVEVETGYVLKDGVWKQIEEIYKLQDGQWVQA